MCACAQSCPVLCNPVNCILEASLSMGFSQQGYWSELPFPLGIFLTQELTPHVLHCRQIFFFPIILFIYLFILLYRIVLVLPYIDLNLRRQILGCWATWCDLLGFPLYELWFFFSKKVCSQKESMSVRLASIISFSSGIAIMCCLMLNVWKQMLLVNYPVFYLLIVGAASLLPFTPWQKWKFSF